MKKTLLFLAGFLVLLASAKAQWGLETLGKRTVQMGYSYVHITGYANVDQNVYTMVCLSCTVGAPAGYTGTYDIYMVPHGGPGQFLLDSSIIAPLNQGLPISQSKTAETGAPVNYNQNLWIRGGGYWDISIGWLKDLLVIQ